MCKILHGCGENFPLRTSDQDGRYRGWGAMLAAIMTDDTGKMPQRAQRALHAKRWVEARGMYAAEGNEAGVTECDLRL